MTIWELDFYSRPILDENKKKVWEVLICESPTGSQSNTDNLFKYAQFCSNKTVNSIWLREAINQAIAQSNQTPKKIRFFRRQMQNMITKACEDNGIMVAPSRRTYALNQWLEERMQDVYPQETGYDVGSAQFPSVQYPALNAVDLPDALKGDRGDQWAFVSLEAEAFGEMQEWDIAFGEAFPLSLVDLSPDARIPGLIIFSPRANGLAAWMSGLELGFLEYEMGNFPRIRLETGVSDSWILVNITDTQTQAEAEGFNKAKEQAKGIHFLAIQSDPESESFAGFWLMNYSKMRS